METLFQDLRYGVRMLRTHPSFTAVAVLSLALGIGANTAIFSLINAVLLKMLPVKNPQELALFTVAGARASTNFSYPLYEQLRDHNRSFSGVIAAGGVGRMRMVVSEPGASGQTEQIRAQLVSGNFFSVLGVNTVIGRALAESDDQAASPQPAAVISYGFWQRRFGSDPAVVGKQITLNDAPLTIVGVAPPKFFGFEVGSDPDLWWPMRMIPQVYRGDQRLNDRTSWWLRVMGRLQPGTSQAQARAEADVVFQQLLAEMLAAREARPGGSGWTTTERRNFLDRRIELEPGAAGWTTLRQQFRQPLFILMTVVALVLLIACANVANLLLARAASRQREIAVRLAIGAGRWRLIRQLLTESVLLASLGGALGLIFAHWGTRLLVSYQSGVTLDLTLDGGILGFTMGVSLLTGLLFGLAPALRATRLDLNSALKEKISGLSRSRLALNKVLVVVQVALSLFLLIGAGLFVRTLQNLKSLDAGFDRENIVLFEIDTGSGYDNARSVSLYTQVLARLEALPGARSASRSMFGLLMDNNWSDRVEVAGYTPQSDENMECYGQIVGPKFFETMGMQLLLGRDFGSQDERPTGENTAPPTRRVAVINQTMARYFFGNDNPIGKHFNFRGRAQNQIEIVGVVKDTKYRTLREQTPRTIYMPFYQNAFLGGTFVLRTVSDPTNFAAAIRGTVQEIDPKLQVLGLRTMNDVVDRTLVQERFVAELAGFFSLFALLLASIGLYGIMSYGVVRRTSEIGIRMALGAQRGDIIWLVMRETLLLVIIGAAIGLPAALAATRLISSQLFGLTGTDPVTLSLATLLLIVVAAFAGYLPAKRASRVDPMVALRYE